MGWLVVAGGMPSDPMELVQVCDRLIEKADPSLPAIWIDPERGPNPGIESMIEDLDLVLPTPVERLEPGQAIPSEAIDAGLIVMGGADSERWSETLGPGGTGEWVMALLEKGSVVFAGGAAAAALGDLVLRDESDEGGHPGLGWLPGALLLPRITNPADDPAIKRYLTQTDHSYALGLQEGTAVAIGPQGEVEVWTGEPPKLVLGRGWMPE